MIQHWMVTGDLHGEVKRFKYLEDIENPSEVGIIILGDSGLNYFLNHRDYYSKLKMNNYGFQFYLVRGNHEQRPELIKTMKTVYDEEVDGEILMEEEFPNIHYLKDGYTYVFNGLKTLVIGGAYSVDKQYRLAMGWSWFPQEQLSLEEKTTILDKVKNETFDLVLTHTCPIEWEPTDLFLSMIDQSTVDKSTEIWLQELKENINWTVWLFGHYHADRIEHFGAEQLFKSIDDLDKIWDRWVSGDLSKFNYIRKSPYMQENIHKIEKNL